MIRTPTVLILGAGASAEYGFPVGYSLYENVCRGYVGTPPLPPRKEHLQHDADIAFEGFRTQLAQSGQLSVDAFLETRPDLIDIGKRAIACGLIPFEIDDGLFLPSNTIGTGPRWYQLLLAELGNSFDAFAENKLSVLTFNYDRSLEHFLVVALSRKYNLPRSKTWQQVQRIPIYHLYGSLGAYTPDGYTAGRTYTNEITSGGVQACVDSIRILREGADHDEVFASAHRILEGAERVVILGFGFDRTNLERLKIDLVPQGAHVCASGFKMTEHERNRAKAFIGRSVTFGADHEGVSAFLRSHVALGER